MDGKRVDQLARALAGQTDRRNLLKTLLGGTAAGVLAGVGLSRPRPAEAASVPAIEYFALGDSVASGYGLMDVGGVCRRSGGAYPYKVRQQLSAVAATIPVRHLACSGATSAQLKGQVDAVFSRLATVPADRPVLVSITIGVDDFHWSNPLRFADLLLIKSDADFQAEVARVVAGVKGNLKQQVGRLLGRRSSLKVVVTEVHNPLNQSSVFFPVDQRPKMYNRSEYALKKLNEGYAQAVAEVNQPRRFALTAGLKAAFTFSGDKFHASPRTGNPDTTCGASLPDVADTWIQHPADLNSNSFSLRDVPFGPYRNWRGDCLHPNNRGAKAFADAVVRVARGRLGFTDAVVPTIVGGPSVTPFIAGAKVTWATDVFANGVVEYGRTTAYGQRAEQPESAWDHAVTLQGLEPGTAYHYRVRSASAAGTATSQDGTFTTAACPSGAVFCPDLKLCKNLQIDEAHCGACGHACAAGETCCAGRCVNRATDPANCGTCGHVCPPTVTCAGGACDGTCADGRPICKGSCCNSLAVCIENVGCCPTVRACGSECCAINQFCEAAEDGTQGCVVRPR